MLVHPSSIGLSGRTLRCLTGQLASRRREIKTRWRCLAAGRQAPLAPARPRCGDTPPASGRGYPQRPARRRVRYRQHNRVPPSPTDIRLWCRTTGATDQAPDLIAASQHAESLYRE
ncbi:hypothetical protein [Streptomyces yerevanensis]|uniref:hypothetical protein n=1 Tax=Streptomyces yerevanensis TaxID=66378 RepID=UPI003CCC2CBC